MRLKLAWWIFLISIIDSKNNKSKAENSHKKLRRYDSLDVESTKLHSHHAHPSMEGKRWGVVLHLAFQSIGVVYGDISTSPLYVYASTFSSGINHNDDILGVMSLIMYTLTLIPLFKYVLVVLRANDNGNGGTFALYSLICRCAGNPTSVCEGLLSHFISRLAPLTLHRPFSPVGKEQNCAVGMPKRTICARHGDRWLYLAPSVETPSEVFSPSGGGTKPCGRNAKADNMCKARGPVALFGAVCGNSVRGDRSQRGWGLICRKSHIGLPFPPVEEEQNRAVRMPKWTICARHGDRWLYLASSVGTPSGVTRASAAGG
ncbi:hypothetical protein TEA_001473 [Camellia sinensis var. sinensis]|uniref:K+ potassium transporter integral membrane domain-containing protein n=1 Tax=Camellia sinensis var. sinensis TaxID=542762 RepID=A0A4S4E9V9_CAMSN|nr:hypothetical protein TEA_001473 [Camellia sinensis var. sinensis]